MKTEIIIGNQAVRVKTSDPQLRIILQGLFDHLTYFELVANPQTKKYTRKPSMYFFVYKEKEDYVDFIISKNNFNDLLYQLKVSEINKVLFKVYNRTYIDHKVGIKLHGNFIPRESQENYIRNIVETGITNTLLDLQTGFGKSVSVDTPIRIPNGWKNIGDIQVGDEVISQDGSITNVIGVYPQGELDMYKITFYDGRSAECCLEHLWKVHNRYYPEEGKVISTADLIKELNRKGDSGKRFYIPLITSEQNEDKKFIIHPYVLGVLLGDGSFSSNNIMLTCSSKEVVKRFSLLLPKSIKIKPKKNTNIEYYVNVNENFKTRFNIIKQKLLMYGLWGKKSYEKFIPNNYLNGSTEQRLELLRGLLDTDGDVCKGGTISYSTSSEKLSENVSTLVRSLGGICKISTRQTYYTYKEVKKAGRVSYRCIIE